MAWASLYEIAAAVLAAVKADIADSPYPLPSGARIGIVNGEIAWDSCEKCGQLAITEDQVFFSDNFPVPANATPQGNCAAALLCADYTLQLVRCAPIPDGQGTPPPLDALDRSARELMSDAPILMRTTACALADMVAANSIHDYLVKSAVAVGPAGACVGNQLNFTIAVVN
jgi:hypothetical protein